MVRLAISERRELLIAAAWRVMTRDGVAAATTRAICAEADMPQSAFHYCFDTRSDLLRIVVTSRLPEHLKLAMAAIDSAQAPRDRIRMGLQAWWDDVRANPESHAVMFDITLHAHYAQELSGLGEFQYAAAHEAVRTLLEHLAADGLAWNTDLDELAVTVVAFLDGITLRYLVDPKNASFEAMLDAFADSLADRLQPVGAGSTV